MLSGGPCVQVSGQAADPSHRMVLLEELAVWQCTSCGFFAPVGGRALGAGLAAVCPPAPTATGAEYLRRTARGLWPKAGKRGVTSARVRHPIDEMRDQLGEEAEACA